ncbi:MAG: hypothetical protein KGH83_05735 [Thaumarchaeota archaeon]|nr:hypothetical protein [Nitrososphaerota archaeon]
MSEDFVKDVKTLLASGKGDAKRIREILDSIKQKNPVYMSDYKYVQSLISEESREKNTETKSQISEDAVKMDNPIDLLKIRLAEGKITIDEFRELKKAITEF